ncbi:GPN-loop GTPase 1 [Nymphaea thermarum]|nr:GPN-loop GTPase 1 [Nymphaea thermarum]
MRFVVGGIEHAQPSLGHPGWKAGAQRSKPTNLRRTLSLMLDEFYKNLKTVGVSARDGEGVHSFFKAVEPSAEEYMESYKIDLDKGRAEKESLEEERPRANMERFRKDMEKTGGETVVLSTGMKVKQR